MQLASYRKKNKVYLLRIALLSLYLSIIVFLPFLHNHPFELGKPEPKDCPAHAFIIASYGVISHVVPIIVIFFSFINILPISLIRIKNPVFSLVDERAPPILVSKIFQH